MMLLQWSKAAFVKNSVQFAGFYKNRKKKAQKVYFAPVFCNHNHTKRS